MSRVPLNDLHRGYVSQADQLQHAMSEVLDSGWYVHGPQHAAFESEFAGYLGLEHVLGVASGTDALELALSAVATPTRQVVVTAANAGGYTSVAARRSGLRLRYADVSADTLCLDPAAVEPLLSKDVAAVVVTHLYGRLADVERLSELCEGAGVPLVEDCAQAVGAARDGRRAGAFGEVATFSFYPTKNLGALGDGGAVVTSDAELAAKLRSMRQYGWGQKYVIETGGGRNSRLDEVQAAVLRVRLPHVDEANARRRSIVSRYVAVNAPGVRVLPADGQDHVAHLAVALCDDREAVRAALSEAGVATDVHYPVPDHLQPALRDQHDGRTLPVTEDVASRLLTLPCFPELTDDEVDRVCRGIAGL